MEPSKTDVANYASDRYAASIQEIDRIRNGIYHNRKGQVALSDIQAPNEASRLAKRIAREGLPPGEALERINGVPNFQDVLVLRKILKLSESVCRIMIRSSFGGSGYGTGFLIAPNVLITNNHVLPDVAAASNSLAQFRYELLASGASDPVTFKLRPDLFFMTSPLQKQITEPYSGLDFTLVALAGQSEEGLPGTDFQPVRLDQTLGKIIDGENCIVIQHPGGDYKKVVLKDIRMLTLTDNFLIYESDTLPGSSGSMVVGLGTGEIVALHHSGVPRRNNQGQWLRKDGTVAAPGDADDCIDWVGNEGIRVSSILKALAKLEIPPEMEKYRTLVMAHSAAETPGSEPSPSPASPLPETAALPAAPASTGGLQYFEVELSDLEALQEDWKSNPRSFVPDLVKSEPIFPYASDAGQRRFFYLTVRSGKPPWELAATLEALPHIDSCTPDLPVLTDVGPTGANSNGQATRQESQGSALNVVYNDGTARWNEQEFLEQWREAAFCKAEIAAQDLAAVRRWNRKAVNFPDTRPDTSTWEAIKNNIGLIKVVQLDTGYTIHSKVKEAYDLQLDMDFIDNDTDAREEQARWILKQPSHGTRTASLMTGGSIQPQYDHDGNEGILYDTNRALIKLIPYRIAKSVVMLGSGRDMVNAASHAISTSADILLICLGSYPRPMMEKVARQAYDNGVIWVCAAGNVVEMVVAPALYPGTIAVAATNPNDLPWSGTSYGEAVDIAAPGEAVYVPFVDEEGREIMAYADGTSYSAPQVAAAAALWKALHAARLRELYPEKWQVAEAFRHCLRASARKPANWTAKMYHMYGAGILDIDGLLKYPLPEPTDPALSYAYREKNAAPRTDLGVRETVHFLWNSLQRKVRPGHQEAMDFVTLTPRGQTALNALVKSQPGGSLEATTGPTAVRSRQILNDYFESFRR